MSSYICAVITVDHMTSTDQEKKIHTVSLLNTHRLASGRD